MRILILISFFVVTAVQAQTTIDFFNDSEVKTGTRIYCHTRYGTDIIVGTRSFEHNRYYPTIFRLDTLGNTVWSSATNDTSRYNSPSYSPFIYIERMFIDNNNDIYAVCYDFSTRKRELWKVNINTGNIIWKKKINFGYNQIHGEKFIADFDSTKFIYTYNESLWNQVSRIAFISKATGDTISTHSKHHLSSSYTRGIVVDNQKNIYYTNHDSIFKVYGSNPDSILWATQYPSINISWYQQIVFDSTFSTAYLFGISGSGKILKINTTDGSLITHNTFPRSGAIADEVKIINNFLYVNWQANYQGPGSGFWLTKYNMIADTAMWHFDYSWNGGGMNYAMSFDLDNSENIYMTGIYGPYSNWGMIKVNGNDGSVIYTADISIDTITNNDHFSGGIGMYVINNTPYSVGVIQPDSVIIGENSVGLHLKNEPISGNVLNMKFFGGDHKFSANTLYIENYPPDKTIVLTQTGRKLKLEMYDISNTILWQKIISKEYYLNGGNLVVASNGDIYMSAYTNKDSSAFPFYTKVVDSMYVYKFDVNGNLLQRNSTYIGLNNFSPHELHVDNSFNVIVFYRINNNIFYTKMLTNGFTSAYNTSITFSSLSPTSAIRRLNFYQDINTNKGYIFGYRNSSNRVVELDKNTMNLTNIALLPSQIRYINKIAKLDANHIILGGRSNNNLQSIVLYNTSIMDTVWTKTFNGGRVVDLKLNTQKNHLYVLSEGIDIITRKINMIDGSQIWEHIYDTTTNVNNYGIDFDIQESKGYVLISGIRNTLHPFAYILDFQGTLLDTVVLTQDYFDFYNWNYALCAHSSYDGSFWIGGNINDDTLGNAGFIIILDTIYIIPTTIINQPVNTTTCEGNSINLTVTASGMNLIYQWRKNGIVVVNGSNISGADSPSLTIDPASLTDTGTYDVEILSSTGDTVISSTALVIINSLPGSIGTISGTSKVCNYEVKSYSVNPVLNATNYIWIVPSGSQIISGTNTNNINVKFGNLSGNIEVVAMNSCSTTSLVTLPIQVKNCVSHNNNINSPLRNINSFFAINIFPNPVNSALNIYFVCETEERMKIKLYDAIAKVIIEEWLVSEIGLNEKQLDLTHLFPGIYFIEITTSNEIIREKLIVN